MNFSEPPSCSHLGDEVQRIEAVAVRRGAVVPAADVHAAGLRKKAKLLDSSMRGLGHRVIVGLRVVGMGHRARQRLKCQVHTCSVMGGSR